MTSLPIALAAGSASASSSRCCSSELPERRPGRGRAVRRHPRRPAAAAAARAVGTTRRASWAVGAAWPPLPGALAPSAAVRDLGRVAGLSALGLVAARASASVVDQQRRDHADRRSWPSPSSGCRSASSPASAASSRSASSPRRRRRGASSYHLTCRHRQLLPRLPRRRARWRGGLGRSSASPRCASTG